MKINPELLLEFCKSERQTEVVNAIIASGTVIKAAKLLGINRRSVYRTLNKLEERAASKGVAPHRDLVHQTAEGFDVKRISTAYKGDEPVLQWVIQEPEKRDLREKVEAMVEGLTDDLTGLRKSIKQPDTVDTDYCASYFIGDHHFGMLADSQMKLSNDDWDIKIATKALIDAVDRLSNRVGNAHTAVLCNVGDFFHADSSLNTTTKGTPVDVDSRSSRTFKLAGQLFQILIDKLLTVHQEVVVVNVRGNHDYDMACHLSSCIELMYQNEPRITVLENYSKFLHWEWGNNLFVYHHGDRIKPEQILQTVVKNLDEEWSNHKNRYCHLGHIHHHVEREYASMQFSWWGSLTSTDQWHDDQGYGAERSMTAVVYHKDYGEDSRVKITMEEIDG
ncbi:helix-turn-helix domain-containing protein [bacterium]|nr:helix-turn-helix domain-containing protein [bacterium]MDA7760514.1 helix-turn-helix domain-containing protein [bacterium]